VTFDILTNNSKRKSEQNIPKRTLQELKTFILYLRSLPMNNRICSALAKSSLVEPSSHLASYEWKTRSKVQD